MGSAHARYLKLVYQKRNKWSQRKSEISGYVINFCVNNVRAHCPWNILYIYIEIKVSLKINVKGLNPGVISKVGWVWSSLKLISVTKNKRTIGNKTKLKWHFLAKDSLCTWSSLTIDLNMSRLFRRGLPQLQWKLIVMV